MRIKQLSTAEQIKLLKELDLQEREFDKNQCLSSGNEYSLKHVHGIDFEPPTEDSLKNAINYRPITNQLKNIESLLANSVETSDDYEKEDEEDDEGEDFVGDDDLVGEIVVDDVLAKYKLPKFTEINAKNVKHVKNLIKKTNKSIGYMKSSLKKSGLGKSDVYKAHDKEIKVLQNLQKDLDVFFSTPQSGSGLMKFGKFYINTKALNGGSLKIRKANQSKVPGIEDCEISQAMVKALRKRKCDLSLNSDELELFKKLAKSCNVKVSSSGQGVVLTNENEVIDRFFVLLGEMKAGNTSHLLKTELVHLGDFLLKKNHISKDTYMDIMNLMKDFE